jgi:tape measure domain-containing protein
MAAPELKLSVGLDLTAFRKDMQKAVQIAQSEFAAQLNIKFNRTALDQELNNLQRAIKRRVYRVEIGGNLDTVPAKINALKESLKSLEGQKVEIPVTAKAAATQKDVRAVRASLYQSIVGEEQGKILVPVSIRPAITLLDVAAFKREVNSKLAGITVKVKAEMQGGGFAGSSQGAAGLMEFMQQQGMIGRTASGMKMQMGDPENIKRSLENVRQKADKLAADLKAMGDAAQRTGKASIEEGGKVLRPQNFGLKIASLTSDIEKLGQEIRKASVKTGSELLGDLDSLSNSLLSSTNSFVKIAGTGNALDSTLRRFDSASKYANTAVIAYADRIRRRAGISPLELGAGQPLLPGSAGGALARTQGPQGFDFGEIKQVEIRNAFDIVRDFNAQRLRAETREFGKALADALRQARREIDNARVRLTSVREIPGRTMALPGTTVAGMLPPAIGMSAREARIAQAYQRSEARGLAVMAGGGGGGMPPALPPGAGRTPSPYGGGGQDAFAFRRAPGLPSGPPPATRLPAGYHEVNKLTKGLGDADKYLRQARVPLAGAITDLGNQFGYAIKQVLLFGTAYKGLAFFMDLPRQAFDATKSLQLFENQINILTGSASEANQAFSFIDELVGRFNIPLQSAREGFAQLYASMSPAGIPIGEVENLFEGMSTAAATLGMSSAEMDRMTLAFSQMASKGKIMTEEVTRQLGDVLPGALAKMAQAAQMEIPEFIDAMQKGQLSGEAMSAVLFNMGIILKRDFGEGASNAASLLQGAMNDIQNSVQRMYEAFRPIVEDLAAQAMPALAQIVKDVTKGVQTFAASFSSADKPLGELSGTALTVFNILNSLREIIKGIGVVFASILPTLAGVGKTLLFIAEQVARFINTGFGGWLANVAVQALLLNAALTKLFQLLVLNLLPVLLATTKSLLIFSARLQAVAVAKGVATAATFAFTGALKLLLIPLLKFAAPVAIVAGIMAIADAFGSASKRAGELRAAAIDAANAIRGMSTTEAIQAGRTASSDIKAIQAISGREDVSTRKGFVAVSAEEKAALERSGISTTKQATGGKGPGGIVDVVERNRLPAATLSAEGRKAEADFRVKQNRFEEQQASQELRPVELQGADGTGATGREPSPYDASQLDFIRQAAEQEKLALERRRQSGLISETQFKLGVAELDLETAKATEAEKFRLARLSIARENLTEQDKFNKLKDAEIYKENALAIAKDQHFVATQAITKELTGPLDRAIEENTNQILEQSMLLNNIKQGRGELSLEEKALLEVRKMLNSLSEDEQALMRENIALTEKSTLERLQAVAASEQELELLNLRNRAELALILDPIANRRRELEQQGFEGEDLSMRLTQEIETEGLERLGDQLRGIASSIGDAFGNAFKGIITGTSSVREALAGLFQSIADSFADMVAQMIADWMRTQLLQGFQNIFSAFTGGLGGSLGGSALSGAASAAGNMGSFGFNPGAMTSNPSFPVVGSANGNVLAGGFQAFANGGIVKGPTLGLVGEGRYNEAVVPLPNGKSIPVQMRGGGGNSGLREAMSGSNGRGGGSPILNMSFQSTNINGVEYVSRDQLEQAMAATRRQAASDGATRGMSMTLDKLQQSPSTRSRLGIGGR